MVVIKGHAMGEKALPEVLPGAGLDYSKMPGHWLLAQMGKRVLRPGGLELTQKMLSALRITSRDDVVEFAPGLGVTARTVLAKSPASFVGVERDASATAIVQEYLVGPNQKCVVGRSEETPLEDGVASVIYGEAMLTMQTNSKKVKIVREAFRVLKPGGRYGIHEIALEPDTLSEAKKDEISQDLKESIRVGARPLTAQEWREMLEAEGFEVQFSTTVAMALLEPKRLLQDEGVRGVAKIAFNLAKNPAARKRVLKMRASFQKHAENMSAVAIVAVKPV